MKRLTILSIAGLIAVNAHSQTALTLGQSKELALKNNKTLQNNTREIQAARETKNHARTGYFPKVSANIIGVQALTPLVDYKMEGGNLPVYDGNPANLLTAGQFAYFPGMELSMLQRAGIGVLNIAQPVYTGGKITTANRLAALNVAVKEEQLQLAEDDILLKTEQQYWQIISLEEKEKTLDRYELLLDDVRKQVDDAFKAGLVIRNDVLKVSIRQSELKAARNKLENGKALAVRQLCMTLGIPYDAALTLKDTIGADRPPTEFYTDHPSALINRTGYRLLEKSVEAARLQTRMKQADSRPVVMAGLAGYHLNVPEKGGSSRTNGLVYAGISLPVSDWWNGRHGIREHRIREQIAEGTLEDSRQLLDLQMEKARTDMEEAWTQTGIIRQTLLQAEENLRVSRTGYQNGMVTLSDLLEAQALFARVSDNLAEAKTQYLVAVSTYKILTNQ